jgi:hypothetical protein
MQQQQPAPAYEGSSYQNQWYPPVQLPQQPQPQQQQQQLVILPQQYRQQGYYQPQQQQAQAEAQYGWYQTDSTYGCNSSYQVEAAVSTTTMTIDVAPAATASYTTAAMPVVGQEVHLAQRAPEPLGSLLNKKALMMQSFDNIVERASNRHAETVRALRGAHEEERVFLDNLIDDAIHEREACVSTTLAAQTNIAY